MWSAEYLIRMGEGYRNSFYKYAMLPDPVMTTFRYPFAIGTYNFPNISLDITIFSTSLVPS
jgi:hypothetical protein